MVTQVLLEARVQFQEAVPWLLEDPPDALGVIDMEDQHQTADLEVRCSD